MLQNNNKFGEMGGYGKGEYGSFFFQLLNCIQLVVMNLHLYVFRIDLCVFFTCICCVLYFC